MENLNVLMHKNQMPKAHSDSELSEIHTFSCVQISRSASPSLHLQHQVVAVGVLVARRVGPFCSDPQGALPPAASPKPKVAPLYILQNTRAPLINPKRCSMSEIFIITSRNLCLFLRAMVRRQPVRRPAVR